MSATEIIAIIVGLGGFVTAIVTARNSASQSSVNAMVEKARVEKEKRESDYKLAEADRLALAKLEEERRAAVDREFTRLTGEIARQEEALNRRRGEIERLWNDLTSVRDQLASRDREMQILRQELAAERAQNSQLSRRTSELESRVAELSTEREILIDAMKSAGVKLPEKRRKDTGPLVVG